MSDQLPYEIEVPDRLVQHVRLYSGDLPEFNRLIEGTEVSDEKIRMAIQLYINNFNTHPPITNEKYVATTFPNYKLLFHGVMIELLVMAGIVHSRNFLNFNDGGVSFTVNDKGNDYMQWIQTLMQTHAQEFQNVKVGINAEEAYDLIASPEDFWIYEDLQ